MPIRISNLRLSVDEPETALPSQLAKALQLTPEQLDRWRILRKSLDVRDKRDVAFVYTVEVATAEDESRLVQQASRQSKHCKVELYHELPFEMPPAGPAPLEHRPVIIGAGPAGVFAAYFLSQAGYQPLVLERGRAVRERIRDVQAFDEGGPHNAESNYLFGEGGAGTFSDGKLTCRTTGPEVHRVLEILAESKGRPSILYDHRPHLGSNRLPAVVKALRQRIEAWGGEYRFDCRVEDLDLADGRIKGLATSSGYIPAGVVVLAIGHSARDTYEMLLARGVPMIPKPFQFGVRIEQPQEQVNRAQYGANRLEEKLGAADYTLVARGAVNVFSFCMCAGGYVMPSVSEAGYFCTNGMSLSHRDSPFANSGLMVSLEPKHFGSSHILAGMHLQREFERRAFEVGRGSYACPIQWADDYLKRRPGKDLPPSSYVRSQLVAANIRDLVPPVIGGALDQALPLLDRRWRGLFLQSATLVGPEARGSSPVRFLRDDSSLESPGICGLYPVGEGAGYAGGIVSAALDGLKAAREIIRRYAALAPR